MSCPSSFSIATSKFCVVFLYCLVVLLGWIMFIANSPMTATVWFCVCTASWNGLVMVV